MSIFIEHRGIILEAGDNFEIDKNTREFLDYLIDTNEWKWMTMNDYEWKWMILKQFK